MCHAPREIKSDVVPRMHAPPPSDSFSPPYSSFCLVPLSLTGEIKSLAEVLNGMYPPFCSSVGTFSLALVSLRRDLMLTQKCFRPVHKPFVTFSLAVCFLFPGSFHSISPPFLPFHFLPSPSPPSTLFLQIFLSYYTPPRITEPARCPSPRPCHCRGFFFFYPSSPISSPPLLVFVTSVEI